MIKLIKIIYFIILSFYFLFFPNVNAQEKIKIGLLVPMTGENKEIGESIIKAVGLAVKDIDNDLIEIYPKDTATKANQTLKSAFELSEMGIKIVIGPVFYESLTYLDEMKDLIGKYIYGFENEDLEKIIGKLLNDQSMTLATAESCTGGLVSHRLTNVPGSSEYYVGGIVSYSNDVKAETLGVSKTILEEQGAVSKETACEMAENIRSKLSADLGLSITGIAGPAGGTKQKPVGLVYIGVKKGNKIKINKCLFKSKKRSSIQKATVKKALDLILRIAK